MSRFPIRPTTERDRVEQIIQSGTGDEPVAFIPAEINKSRLGNTVNGGSQGHVQPSEGEAFESRRAERIIRSERGFLGRRRENRSRIKNSTFLVIRIINKSRLALNFSVSLTIEHVKHQTVPLPRGRPLSPSRKARASSQKQRFCFQTTVHKVFRTLKLRPIDLSR